MFKLNLKLENFEGPFDLLFHLIEKNKINLYDIPIAKLTEQYIYYLDEFHNIDMDNISEFLVMASTLLEIKSRMLLPTQKFKEENSEDPRDELVRRLIEYKLYKKVSKIFSEKEIFIDKIFFKQQSIINDKIYKAEDFLENITLDFLHNVFVDVLNRKELKVDKVRASFDSITNDTFTIKSQINYILDVLKKEKQISFLRLFNKQSTKIEIVVSFIAILEMVKIKLIKLEQNFNNNIIIERTSEVYDF